MTRLRLGVPSFCTPVLTDSRARTGLEPPAQITLRALATVLIFAVVDGTDIFAFVALVTLLSLPLLAVWVTRSPPRTGSPA